MLTGWSSEKLANEPPRNRIWFHKSLGLILVASGESEKALRHLEQAYRLDPHDRDVAVAYGGLLYENDRLEKASGVIRTVLVHHKDELDIATLGRLTRYLGRYHQKRTHIKRARALFDEAIALDPDDQLALNALLELIDDMPKTSPAIRARKALLKRLRNPISKARVLARQGDDLRKRDRNPKAALWCYKEALTLQPTSIDLLERKASTLAELGKPEEAIETLLALLDAPEFEGAEDRVKVLETTYELFKSSVQNREQLISVVKTLLELKPDRLELFEELTTLRADMEQWAELARDYKRAILWQQKSDSDISKRILPLLWRNLAELLDTHTDQVEDSISAYVTACKLRPKDIETRRRLVDLCLDRDDKILQTILTCRELLELIPGDTMTARILAERLLKGGERNEAFCITQVLRSTENSTSILDKFYDRVYRKSLKMPVGTLTDELRRRHLRTGNQSYVLTSIMAIANAAFQNLFHNDLKFHQITEKDRLNLDESLLFNRIFKAISQAMTWIETPRVYKKPSTRFMSNAMLVKPSMVVGPDMLAGRRDREIAFIVGQQLSLLRPEYVLTTMYQPKHLRSIVLLMVNYVEPTIEVKLNDDLLRLRRELDKRLTASLRNHLTEVVSTIIKSKADVNVDSWVETVADEANRTGLLFCDDLEVADTCLSHTPGTLADAEIRHRRNRLHAWSMSNHRVLLRKHLGLAKQS